MKKIFITRKIQLSAIKLLKNAGFELNIWSKETAPSRLELIENTKNVDGILSMITDSIDEEILNNSPNLHVVSNMAVGHNNIDIKKASEMKIMVGHTPGVLTTSTAELCLTLILMASKNVNYHQNLLLNEKWQWHPTKDLSIELSGKTLGIVGMGRIGQKVAQMASHGLGMNICFYSRSEIKGCPSSYKSCENLKKLCTESDIISLHTNLNPETKNLIDMEVFKLMKKKRPIIVNTSRGEVINQNHLLEALNSEFISFAALDVTDPEPLDSNHPLILHPKTIITPHIGSATERARELMAMRAALNIVESFSDQPNGHFVVNN